MPARVPRRPTAAGAVLSRAKNNGATAQSHDTPKEETTQRKWVPVTTPQLAAAGVKAYALPGQQAGEGIVLVQMKVPLNLPGKKGPVLEAWQGTGQCGRA